jgi:protein TonB
MSATVADTSRAGDAPRQRPRLVDAFVVAADDSFILELGPLIGTRFRARPVERVEDVAAVDSVRWLALIDATTADAHTLVHQLETRFPDAPLIAVVAEGQQARWSSALARGSVIAIIPRSGLAGPALQHALADAERRLGVASAASQTASWQRPQLVRGGSRKPLPLIVGGLLLLALAAGGYFIFGRSAPAPLSATPAATPATPSAAAPETVDSVAAPAAAADTAPDSSAHLPVLELLSQARVAFRDPNRLIPRENGSRRGDSAIELYAAVLAQDPTNAEARDGVRRLFAVARSRLQSDLGAGRVDEAQRMLALFTAAGVDAASTAALQADIKATEPKAWLAQLRRALNAGDLATAEQNYAKLAALGADRSMLQDVRKVMDARATDLQLQTAASELRSAIESGNLLEPAATSARTRLLAMRQLSRTHPTTLAAQKSLQEALLARARESLQAQQLETAQRWISAAGEFGTSSELADLRRRAQELSEQLAARSAAAAAQVAAPAKAAPAAAAPGYVAARATSPLSVNYPERAAATNTKGYVIVEFTLNANGRATNIGVVESQPAGIFDRAATDAVARGRFDVSVLAADRQPARARLRLTFKPG